MTDRDSAPWHLWVVGMLATLWNGFGATDYTMTQLQSRSWYSSMGFDEPTTNAIFAYFETTPAWADAAWACGTWGGVVGALLLLARSRWAVPAFFVSIAGAIASTVFQAGAELPPEMAEMGGSSVMYVVIAIAALLIWYATNMRGRGVLK